jgi:hypothetical protein
MHAEATSEKVAMGWHLDGRVSVLFGTHTHIPTADERILPKGTAYITDVGMTGPYDSVLGRNKDRVVGSMISGVPSAFDVAEADIRLCGILVTVDAEAGRAAKIERVRFDATAQSEPRTGATRYPRPERKRPDHPTRPAPARGPAPRHNGTEAQSHETTRGAASGLVPGATRAATVRERVIRAGSGSDRTIRPARSRTNLVHRQAIKVYPITPLPRWGRG